MPIHEVKHPLIRHKLGLMRRADISTKNFRELAQEVGALLTYEATKDFNLQEKTIEGWAGPVNVEQIHGKKITIVPILRAGLGMMDGVLSLIPVARVSVVGQIRDELATGGSMISTIDLLKQAGSTEIRALVLVAAPEGIEKVLEKHPDVSIYTASVDERLNDKGYILPGLGDAGDKIFGTKQKDI